MLNSVFEKLDELFPEMVEIRRDLHMYPELSFQEVRTPKLIAEYHEKLGNEVRKGVGERGVVATMRGGKPGKTVALRADFDALPIEEENDVPYKSKVPGVMHACGHDAHTAILLGVAKALKQHQDEIEGNVVFIHQHAEEGGFGAKYMVEDGALEGVDAIFATHMENYANVGEIHYTHEYILGAADRFEIHLNGKGGHAALPHDTQDLIVVGSQLVNNLQSIISRRTDPMKPAVLTIGAFHAGEAGNVIGSHATLRGTIRVFDESVRQDIKKMIHDVTHHTCAMSGVNYEIELEEGYPSTWNHPKETDILVEAAKKVVGEKNVIKYEKNLGAEDFSYFLNEVPGSYFFTGSANPEKGLIYPYHHPKFDIDEDSLLHGAKTMAAVALDYLKS